MVGAEAEAFVRLPPAAMGVALAFERERVRVLWLERALLPAWAKRRAPRRSLHLCPTGRLRELVSRKAPVCFLYNPSGKNFRREQQQGRHVPWLR